MNNKRGFVAFIGLILAVGIVLILGYYVTQNYLSDSSSSEDQNFKAQGLNPSRASSMLETSKEKIHNYEKQMHKRTEGLLEK